MSTFQNPFEPPQLDPTPLPVEPRQQVRPIEDPPWFGVDVLLIVGATILMVVVLPTLLILAARLLVFKNVPVAALARKPQLVFILQTLIYILVFALMYKVIRARTGTFWQAVGWNWPRTWGAFLSLGVVVCFGLSWLGAVLPIPKNLPIEQFFATRWEAIVMSIFAVTLAPLMEELFFRGLLYPTLTRWIGNGAGALMSPRAGQVTGMVASIVITAAVFGLLHGAQLGYSWAVLIIFLVGIVLTVVRAVTRSVGASFLVHLGYNATLTIISVVATGGFRHLEKLSQ